MLRKTTQAKLAALVVLVFAPGVEPAFASDPLRTSSCVADRVSGVSQIDSSTGASSIEICLRQTNSAATRLSNQVKEPTRTSEPKRVCTSGTVSVRLGPPSYGVRTYKQTVCNGVSKTVLIDLAPQPKPGNSKSSGTTSSIIPGRTTTGQTVLPGSGFEDSAVFQPEAHRVSPETASIRVGTRLTITSLARTHYRTSTVLGEQVSVRFVPVAAVWQIDDGPEVTSTGRGSTLDYLFSKTGTFQVRVEVMFEPEYQIAGSSSWFIAERGIRTSASGQITVDAILAPPVPSQPNPISVPQAPSNSLNQAKPRLASNDCVANPKGRGCTR